MGQVLGIFVSNGGVPKLAVDTAEISLLGLVGDDQADKKHHGGEMKAVCVLENEILDKVQSEGMATSTGLAILVARPDQR